MEKTNAEKIIEALEKTKPINVDVIGRRVVLKPIVISPVDKNNGILLPNTKDPDAKVYKYHPYQGIVVAKGPEADEHGKVNVLDRVYFREHKPYVMVHEGETYMFMDINDIVCSIPK